MFIGMTTVDLENILSGLLALPAETEVVEFKKAENGFGEHELGQYFSALSNEANLRGIQCAWLVFGVENRTHEVTGTNYKKSRASLDAVKKTIADQTTGRITFSEIHVLEYNGKRVVMFEVAAAPQGIPIAYKGHYYGRDGESLVALNIQKIEQIRAQRFSRDWSAGIISDASIEDLDPAAISKARELYSAAHSEKSAEIAGWDEKNKIRNLLSKLKKQKKIANDTRGNNSIWRLKVKI